jgi:hypothetical protein
MAKKIRVRLQPSVELPEFGRGKKVSFPGSFRGCEELPKP